MVIVLVVLLFFNRVFIIVLIVIIIFILVIVFLSLFEYVLIILGIECFDINLKKKVLIVNVKNGWSLILIVNKISNNIDNKIVKIVNVIFIKYFLFLLKNNVILIFYLIFLFLILNFNFI